MGKGSKRRGGEDTKKIVDNWSEINWGHVEVSKDVEAEKNKNERKRINDNDSRRN